MGYQSNREMSAALFLWQRGAGRTLLAGTLVRQTPPSRLHRPVRGLERFPPALRPGRGPQPRPPLLRPEPGPLRGPALPVSLLTALPTSSAPTGDLPTPRGAQEPNPPREAQPGNTRT